MAKFKVLTPFVTMGQGGRSYTQGDEYEPSDDGEAQRMIERGILASPAGFKPAAPQEPAAPVVETADVVQENVETAVKPNKKVGK